MKYLLVLFLALTGVAKADVTSTLPKPSKTPTVQRIIVVNVTNTFTVTPIPTKTPIPTATPTLGPDFYAVFKIDTNMVSREVIGRPDYSVHCGTFKADDVNMENPVNEKSYWIEFLTRDNVNEKLEVYIKDCQDAEKAVLDAERKKRAIMDAVN